MGTVGAYSMHIYCDGKATVSEIGSECPMLELAGRSESDCIRQAKKRGWTIDGKTDLVRCPKHRKRNPKPQSDGGV